MVKMATIVGARPQFVKAAMVSRALRAVPGIQEIFIHTGQHFDERMSDVFFSELELPRPDHYLGIHSGSHGMQTGRMLESVERVLIAEQPEAVIVYGDTNTTLAGALAAAKLHIPVLHVEAGLRSYNRLMPEEINRIMTDHCAELLFAPTQTAAENLRQEGVPEAKIHLVGDVMYDAALYFGEKAERHSRILEQLDLEPKHYMLATIHRAGNTDEPERLQTIFQGLCLAAEALPVVLPIHPRTAAALQQIGMFEYVKQQLKVIEPVGYLDMVMLEKYASLIASDSGGVQKEAFFYKVPCATLRSETEWTELLDLGWNRLVSMEDSQTVCRDILAALELSGKSAQPYGRGEAAWKIANMITEWRREEFETVF
ncbi:non-hydrolyzing UDP-N-acetylglucosamine 2-epimerase [Brevibacillus sp. B_LB10_24]|uniref:non-hydrolyzing UDP-N-acetylglucosamine 2-epimerase n=1 Tax=Brevibacillus sp. B_LB10_24 TaxID=3380645 RepID=UPI0038BBBC4F